MPTPSSDMPSPTPLSYKDAGVDIDAGDALVERIKPLAKRTLREGVLGGLGGFGALFEVPKRYREPVLVSGTDGVGTKLKLAFEWDMHDHIGIDLVAMSVNDILVQGAEPLFFLDYFSCGKLDVDTAERVIAGIAQGCEQAGCALVGGETAEMPGMYPDGEYDLAGFAVGAVEKSKILNGSLIQEGDAILGLPSSGVHSNGYSLVRKILAREQNRLPSTLDGQALRPAIMAPTRIYVRPVLDALAQHPIRGLAHITGGGLSENIPRILPPGLSAAIHEKALPRTELFTWLQNAAAISDAEMRRTFNCGIGMVIVLPQPSAAACLSTLLNQGQAGCILGEIVRSSDPKTPVLYG